VSAEAEVHGRRLISEAVSISLSRENPHANVRMVLHEQTPLDGVASSATGPVLWAHVIAISKGRLGVVTAGAQGAPAERDGLMRAPHGPPSGDDPRASDCPY